MKTLRLILADHLSESMTSLSDIQPKDTILLCELHAEATVVTHHPKKIAFLFAAMRHFAAELKHQGHHVHYVSLTDPANTGHLNGEVQRAVRDLGIERLVVTQPSEYRLVQMVQAWSKKLKISVEIREDQRFLCSIDRFKTWAEGKKQLRMEYFYREMRKQYQILIEADGSPSGGQWNYDQDNRNPPTPGLTSPKRISHKPSALVSQVLKLVAEQFPEHFGTLLPFHYAVTRQQALQELNHFIKHILPKFGEFQDAMVKGEPYLNHSLLATYLNAGLLLPLEICQKAELSYRNGHAPLPAVEGFIRQIIGWREYVRGIYWLKMPSYGELNYFDTHRPLPDFYWGKPTHMACIAEVVRHTEAHAYSHHIQRLMVTGNFALLAGLAVKAVQAWYLAVYSDAYEWVEMPNTLGMALFGDGGIVGSKPYAASGKYIHKMSNFCKDCRYNPAELLAENACPFNALYWNFFAEHPKKLEGNPRLNYVYSTWRRFPKEKQAAIRNKAQSILKAMTDHQL